MIKKIILYVLLNIAYVNNIVGYPEAVFIIRHGEKQLKLDAQGVPITKKNGEPEYTEYLSDKGWMRANAISFDVNFYNNSEHGVPVAIFGSAPNSVTGSLRPIETVTPLAKRLKKSVIKTFKANEQSKVVNAIMHNKAYDGKFVIIGYEHHAIPKLAETFGVKNAPKSWPNDVFDRIWEIRFDTKTGKVLSFANNPQHLLYGDSQN